jgi:hypothetical protein
MARFVVPQILLSAEQGTRKIRACACGTPPEPAPHPPIGFGWQMVILPRTINVDALA